MIKHFILIFFIFTLLHGVPLAGQKKNSFGICSTIATGVPVSYSNIGAKGGPDYKNTGGFSLGIKYLLKLTTNIDLEIGLSYMYNKLTIVPIYDPAINNQSIETIAFIFFPLKLIYNLKNNFFVKGGINISIDNFEEKHTTIKKQTGLGFNFGFGKKFNLGNNFVLNLSPQLRIFNIIPFEHITFNDSYTDLGFSIGINYVY
ncbi:MAG: porin family protein [Chlorobi bacterium]|nr:porin family protein [Chlorobiota bacterium]